MSLLTTLKTGGRAALIALSLGAATLVAAPAQAAGPTPSFGFSFNFGNGGGPGMYFNYGGNPKYACLSDKQIFWQLKNQGYSKVKIVKSKGYNVIVVARYHNKWYQLAVNRCNGKIKSAPLNYNGNGNSGFNITLSF